MSLFIDFFGVICFSQEVPENLGLIPLENIKKEREDLTKSTSEQAQQPLPLGEDR